jgi:hypothetical protein
LSLRLSDENIREIEGAVEFDIGFPQKLLGGAGGARGPGDVGLNANLGHFDWVEGLKVCISNNALLEESNTDYMAANYASRLKEGAHSRRHSKNSPPLLQPKPSFLARQSPTSQLTPHPPANQPPATTPPQPYALCSALSYSNRKMSGCTSTPPETPPQHRPRQHPHALDIPLLDPPPGPIGAELVRPIPRRDAVRQMQRPERVLAVPECRYPQLGRGVGREGRQEEHAGAGEDVAGGVAVEGD